MHSVISMLTQQFGVNHHKSINQWLAVQLAKKGIYEGGFITLQDVNEKAITDELTRLFNTIPLTAKQFFNYVSILPVLSPDALQFEAIAHISADFYRMVITAKKAVTLSEQHFVRKGDVFETQGSDRHVQHSPLTDNDAAITLAYLNGSIEGDLAFSVLLNEDELNAVKTTHIDTFFGGINPFDDNQWRDVYLVALYRRLMDESVFLSLEPALGENQVGILEQLKNWHVERYDHNAITDNKFYNRFGKVVATKTFKFNALERKSQKALTRPSLEVVSSNETPIAREPAASAVNAPLYAYSENEDEEFG